MTALKDWLKQINEILYREWAPIAGAPPKDEYESYAGKIAGMLHRRASEEELLSYLEWVEVENMGLGGPFDRGRGEKVVFALRALPIPPK